MTTFDRVVLNPSVALAPAEDGYLAYDIESGKLHRLNPAAALIVELADGSRDAGAICTEIAPLLGTASFDASLRWIEDAVRNGILKTMGDSESPSNGATPNFSAQAPELREEGAVLAAFVCQYHATLEDPENADEWFTLGELAHIVGRRADARDAYERYLKLKPDNAEVAHILVSLRGDAPPPRAPDICIRQLYSRFAGFYEDNMRGELHYSGPEHLAGALKQEIGELRDADIADLGCGTGLVGPHLRPWARRLIGVDLSPEMAEKARATGLYDDIEVAEITNWLTRCDGRDFDLIAAADTLIYFGDLRQVLVPAARRLRFGGWFGFTVEFAAVGSGFRLTDSGRYEHTLSHIRDASRDAGLELRRTEEFVIRYEYGEPVPGLAAVLRLNEL